MTEKNVSGINQNKGNSIPAVILVAVSFTVPIIVRLFALFEKKKRSDRFFHVIWLENEKKSILKVARQLISPSKTKP